jgi:hypothetical protein
MKKRHSAEQFVGMLRQADENLGMDQKVPEVCRRFQFLLAVSFRTQHNAQPPHPLDIVLYAHTAASDAPNRGYHRTNAQSRCATP